jgi:valyl-tRNA synthetase
MELPTRFDPAEQEAQIYRRWEESGAFEPPAPGEGSGRPFSVVIPPPNVTGVLHMGHALNATIQDIVVRYRRMAGFDTLWVPGTDHAGIATQAVVEKQLAEENLKREDMGREAFLQRVWDWKDKHGDIILQQLRRLGCSCDWTRTAFTMDDKLSHAVRESFVSLWEKGLIYRGMRLVNWDCVLETAISDDEIEYETRKGKLWSLRYPIKDRPGEFIVVATTRPETMLGDTGVAVHPDDERYTELVGKCCVLPFLNREIPIVADESVDPSFGSGAVKITPGHDPADYERGTRHHLPIVSILEKDGTLNEEAGPFAGMTREAARKAVVEQLEELGLLASVENIKHNISLSDRSKSPVEPLISEQWFVKMKPLAGPAIAAAKSGRLSFRPDRWKKVYLDWLENVHDWCISRQLWWGHQIPVWYDEDDVPAASREDLEIGAPHPLTGKAIVRRDPDVLDTWASSWLWPMATLGWPEKTDDLARFYPTGFLSTGPDIIYLWVARMVMAGYAFMGDRPEEERCPFDTVYLHALVFDAKGKKMSKSEGNVINPLDMVDEYGADAVRLGLIMLTKEGQDVRLSPEKFGQSFRFINKVWNAARFCLLHLEGKDISTDLSAIDRLEDRWMLSRLAQVRASVSDALDTYRFNDAAMELYRFVWNDFCDWYLEIAKPRLTADGDAEGDGAVRAVLARVLQDILALLHPFTPHVTEALWEALHRALGREPDSMLVTAAWPDGEGLPRDAEAEAKMGLLQDAVRSVRRVRSLTMLGERKPLRALISLPDADDRAVLGKHAETISALAFLEELEIVEVLDRPAGSAVAVAGSMETCVPLGEDVNLERLIEALTQRVAKVRSGMEAVDRKLGNEQFLKRADPAVVADEKERREELAMELELLERNLSGL